MAHQIYNNFQKEKKYGCTAVSRVRGQKRSKKSNEAFLECSEAFFGDDTHVKKFAIHRRYLLPPVWNRLGEYTSRYAEKGRVISFIIHHSSLNSKP